MKTSKPEALSRAARVELLDALHDDDRLLSTAARVFLELGESSQAERLALADYLVAKHKFRVLVDGAYARLLGEDGEQS